MSNQTVNSIIDLSHYDSVPSFAEIKKAGIDGVVHKATQGTGNLDSFYASRRLRAADAGLLWGAYHFGTGADPVAQAEWFLSNADPASDDLIALDLERNSNAGGTSMDLRMAERFVAHIYGRLNRWPVLYTGAWYLNRIGIVTAASPLARCPLWLASYTPTIRVPEPWSDWTMWQYTDGTLGNEPHVLDDLGFPSVRYDRSLFNGSAEQLRKFWTGAVI